MCAPPKIWSSLTFVSKYVTSNLFVCSSLEICLYLYFKIYPYSNFFDNVRKVDISDFYCFRLFIQDAGIGMWLCWSSLNQLNQMSPDMSWSANSLLQDVLLFLLKVSLLNMDQGALPGTFFFSYKVFQLYFLIVMCLYVS